MKDHPPLTKAQVEQRFGQIAEDLENDAWFQMFVEYRFPWRAVRRLLLIAVAILFAFCVSALFAYGAAAFLVDFL